MSPSHPSHPRRHDLIVVLVVGGVGIVTGVLFLWAMHVLLDAATPGAPSLPAQILFVAANTATAGLLWFHRRRPVTVFAAILTVFVVAALALGFVGNGGLTLPLWFSVFALTAYAPLNRALPAVTFGWFAYTAVKVAVAVMQGYQVTAAEVGLVLVADVGFFFLACSVLGLGFRFQRKRAEDAAVRARLVEEHSRAVHAEAVATERNRLARDLHDLAAHELVDVLLTVRALQIDSDLPELAEIEAKTARALENMRTVVRTLRESEGDTGPEHLSLPDATPLLLAKLGEERDIEITSDIDLRTPVADATTSTVLSILTETVLNAARHAPGAPVTVRLTEEAGDLLLTVTNPIPATTGRRRAGTGYGLIGAAERAGLLGGSFEAGRTTDKSWVATLRLPLETAPETTPLTEEKR